MIMHGREVGYQ